MLRNLISQYKGAAPVFAEDVYVSSSDDEIPPKSVVWKEEDGIDDIMDPKFDWRRETRKGRKSRDNFTNYLFSYL
jgi:hypothetical protein